MLIGEDKAQELLASGKVYRKKILIRAVPVDQSFEVWTHEGLMKAEAGDWLVQNITGDSRPWPIKKKIFEDSYEEVTRK
jgi:hypothetical protein